VVQEEKVAKCAARSIASDSVTGRQVHRRSEKGRASVSGVASSAAAPTWARAPLFVAHRTAIVVRRSTTNTPDRDRRIAARVGMTRRY
jgi:hypothetical protein